MLSDVGFSPAPVFGETIALLGAAADQGQAFDEAGDWLNVVLLWEAVGVPGGDYTVFVHLLDGDENLLGTGDGPPLGGGFPTTMWRPSDRIADPHRISVPPSLPAGAYSVRVGWYDSATGARMPVARDGRWSSEGAFTAATLSIR